MRFSYWFTTLKGDLTILNTWTRGLEKPQDLKAFVEKSLDADKAFDITSINLDDQSGIADYMIIASGTSSRHVSALATKLKERLEARGFKNVRIEGLGQSDWVVLDAGDVVVHVFRPEVRAFYNIEKMWGAPQNLTPSGGSVYA